MSTSNKKPAAHDGPYPTARKVKSTGTTVKFDRDSKGWIATCTAHKQSQRFEGVKQMWTEGRKPAAWCKGCRKPAARTPRAKASK